MVDASTYYVVINEEAQYSIWQDQFNIPLGWSLIGVDGTKTQCLEYINNHWTDQRPLSLRKILSQ